MIIHLCHYRRKLKNSSRISLIIKNILDVPYIPHVMYVCTRMCQPAISQVLRERQAAILAQNDTRYKRLEKSKRPLDFCVCKSHKSCATQ